MITANRVLHCNADTPEEMHHWITLLQRSKGDARVDGQEFIIRGWTPATVASLEGAGRVLTTACSSIRLASQRDEEQHQSIAQAQEALVPTDPQLPGLLQELGAQRPEAGDAGAEQPVLGGSAGREGLQGDR